MNPLVDWPNLFVNGKFKIEIRTSDGDGTWIETLHGVIRDKKGDYWCIPTSSDFSYAVERCTLIARPIEDMTDEEKQRFYEVCEYYGEDYDNYSHYKKWIIQLHKDDSYLDDNGWDEVEEMEQFAKNRPAFLHLLSIGVYPFDQQHFEDGTVININEV